MSTEYAVTSKVVKKFVTCYPSYGYLDCNTWYIPLRLWVWKKPDAVRRLSAKIARKIIRRKANMDKLNHTQKALFKKRTKSFIADGESRENVKFCFEQDPLKTKFQLCDEEGNTKTDRNGLIEGVITISHTRALQLLQAQNSNNGWLTLKVVSKKHKGKGRIRLVPPHGHSVISDIDDTIKITDIPKGHATVFRRTFFEQFKAAPGMLEKYRSYPNDTAFHYVSGGPWQMYEALKPFLFNDISGFPAGSIHMKNVRTNLFESESYDDFRKLIFDGSELASYNQKLAQISELLQRFPDRTFSLIGDSGEMDPEVFRAMKDAYPKQVVSVEIRDVLGDATLRPERLAGFEVIEAS